jgi:multiple inositol-polyphosphate phosphatase/2,3-bisphosphoglycerate 3-phosphatase
MNRSLDPCEVEALWQLCLTEAGLQGKLDQACSLFTPGEAAMLEWMDDVSLMEGHGYGSRINYEIASPLLHDLHDTLKVRGMTEVDCAN